MIQHRKIQNYLFLLVSVLIIILPLTIQAAAKYPVTWTPNKTDQYIGVGVSKTITFTFISSVKLQNAYLWITPEIKPFIASITPSTFASIKPKTPYQVAIKFLVPAGTKTGVYYGNILLKVGSQNFSLPLILNLYVVNAPVANAGPDQTVYVTNTVMLDGSKSSDVDGDLLTFKWSFVSIPEGSSATLSDATAVNPTFVADRFGTYIVQLIVNDGKVDSAPDTVSISTENSPPVANAGPDQTVYVTNTVTLDGSKSSDVDGNLLTFKWSLVSIPEGSNATLSDLTAVNPTFVADRFGTYVVQLIVNDGKVDSAPDTVAIDTENSPPVANAGPDQTVHVTDMVTLDGSGSSDVDGDLLTFKWSFVSIPEGSNATLSDPAVVNPTFVADRFGKYVVQLIVNDGKVDSEPDTVSIDTTNSRPVADAGEDQSQPVGSTITLDGSGSYDVDSDPLWYIWSFTSIPPGSTAVISNPTAVNPSFLADLYGTYIVQLIVNDGMLDSLPDTVSINAVDITMSADISAMPTKGGIPLEVQFSAIVSRGTPPFTYAWDIDGNGTIDDTRQSFNYIYQQAGIYNVTLTVNDASGKSSSDSVIIYALSAPIVVASANPTSGSKPLDVNFSATASDSDGTIVLYEWDFNGDGVYDYSSTDTPVTTHTYTANGLYTATLRVTDNDGLTKTDSIIITVGVPPVASASADPMTGAAPLTVNLSGTGTDSDGTVVLYEWDFDGNGVYDWSSTTTGATTYTYTSSGIFNATLRVTDNEGLIDTDSVLISVSGPPIALPRAYPTSGNMPLKVTFFSDGKDLDGSPEYYDWDFNGDGTYDLHLIASMNTAYTYSQAGTYNATLKVTDNDGLTGTASITITVTNPNPQGVPIATADAVPTNGGAPLKVSLMGSGTDPNGNIVKYEWDFEGDGVYDWEEAAQPSGSIGIDVGSNSGPAFVDIDGDGDFDLFVGESAGRIYYYRNDGSSTSPVWASVGFITDSAGTTIDVGNYSSPAFADIDGDGDFDLFVGESAGRIYYYRNDGSSTSPVWASVGLITNSAGTTIDVGDYSSPAFADIDRDGDTDLFIGEYYGKIYYYRNDGSTFSPLWVLVTNSYNSVDQSYYSKPSFMDFDNDGDYDLFVGEQTGMVYRYPLAGYTIHTYAIPGDYSATLRVTDNSGLTDEDSVIINVLESGSPTAKASATPTTGTAPLTVSFTGLGIDPDGSITLYEWDFDGDGTYDWNSNTTGKTTHIYTTVGTFVTTLRVTDNDGKKATDSVTIKVSLGISTTRTGIFNPTAGETGSICSTLSANALVTIKVIDGAGNVIRTLVDGINRTPGSHCDAWDGKSDSGDLVHDGIYYFLIENVVNGETFTYDPRETAQFSETTPSRSWPSTFNPYDDNFVTVTYSIAKPSEMSLYFWKRDYSRPGSSIAPVRTLFIREPQGAGSHKEIWDGVDDTGAVVGPWSGGYPITLWAYELPDSAVVITGDRPVITSISTEPHYFSPAINPYGLQPTGYTNVSFNLSEASNVEVNIKNSDGIIVKTMTKTNLPAGANTIIWDGKDFAGNLVKEGSYSIALTAIDSDGNRSLPRYAAVIVYY